MTEKIMSFACMVNQLFAGIITKGTFRDSMGGYYRGFAGKLQWVDPGGKFTDDEEDINVSLELVSMPNSDMVGS